MALQKLTVLQAHALSLQLRRMKLNSSEVADEGRNNQFLWVAEETLK
jgi:hypothetical protein